MQIAPPGTLPPRLKYRKSLDTVRSLTGAIYGEMPVKAGVNCVTVLRHEEGHFEMLLHQRATKGLAEYPGFHHVVPAGSFQPIGFYDSTYCESQFDIAFTVLREFLEEVFGLEEAKGDNVNDAYEIFRKPLPSGFVPGELLLSDEHFRNRQVPRSTDLYEIVETGFVIDLVSIKPEFTCLLLLKDELFFERYKDKMKGNYEGRFTCVPFALNNLGDFLCARMSTESMLPAGFVAIVEGLHYLNARFSAGPNAE